MTSREFIELNFDTPSNKERFCSSIFADKDGNIYSYGYHYPLLFKAGGLTFRNTRGYSNTTAKHISWTYGFNAINVELSGCNQYAWRNSENSAKVPQLLYERRYNDKITDKDILKAVVKDLEAQAKELHAEMLTKKRKDTAIYRSLSESLAKVQQSLVTVQERI